MSQSIDFHQAITDRIIEGIERGAGEVKQHSVEVWLSRHQRDATMDRGVAEGLRDAELAHVEAVPVGRLPSEL